MVLPTSGSVQRREPYRLISNCEMNGPTKEAMTCAVKRSWVLASLGAVRIKGREPLLQAVHGRSPLRRRGFAHRILVAEQTNLVHRPLQGHGLKPTHRDEVLAPFRIVDELAVVASSSGNL